MSTTAGGESRCLHLLSILEPLRDKLIERGLLRAGELADLTDALREHLADARTIVVRLQGKGYKVVVNH